MTEQTSPPTYESTDYPAKLTFSKAFKEEAKVSLEKLMAEFGLLKLEGEIAVGFRNVM